MRKISIEEAIIGTLKVWEVIAEKGCSKIEVWDLTHTIHDEKPSCQSLCLFCERDEQLSARRKCRESSCTKYCFVATVCTSPTYYMWAAVDMVNRIESSRYAKQLLLDYNNLLKNSKYAYILEEYEKNK